MMPRNYRAVLLEAELLASSPERVFDRLTALALESTEAAADLDLRTQLLLLQRQHPLIDLALASTSGELTVAAAMFRRAPPATTAPVSPDQEQPETGSPLRLAVLGNRKVFAAPFGRESLESVIGLALDQWYPTATIGELQALVANDAIPDDVLLPLVSAPAVNDTLDDRRRQYAVLALSRSSRNADWTRFGPERGHMAHGRWLLQRRCWELAQWVPPTDEWATVLGSVFERWPLIKTEADSAHDWLGVAQRWAPKDADHGPADSVRTMNRNILRTHLARLAVFIEPDKTQSFLTHSDRATRVAAYRFAALTPDEARGAVHADGYEAYNSLILNDHFWGTDEGREMLRDLEQSARHKSNDKPWLVSRYVDEFVRRHRDG